MAESEREERARRRAAVEREMSRLRAADEAEQTRDEDPVDTVTEEQRRERDVQNGDEPPDAGR